MGRTLLASILLTTVIFLLPPPATRAPYHMTPEQFARKKAILRGPAKQPNDRFVRQRSWPDETLNLSAMQEASHQARAMRQRHSELDETWEYEGPGNVGGRVTALAIHPDAPSVIYAGAATGGVFKSTDGGGEFYATVDDDYSYPTGALSMDPNDPNTVWWGTGEANTSGDSYPGNGIHVTRDGGASWTHMGLEQSYHIARIAIDPTDSNRLFVAATGSHFPGAGERGLYRTENGGEDWERVLFVDDTTACTDVEINPLHPDTMFAVFWERSRTVTQRNILGDGTGLYRSIDGGDTWEMLDVGTPYTEFGRPLIAISPSQPSTIYFNATIGTHNTDLLYRSDDGGDTWYTPPADLPANDLYMGFGWYFGESQVHPTNPDRLYLCGVWKLYCSDAGDRWYAFMHDAHVDAHALWINPENPDQMVMGHDGGVDVSHDGGVTTQIFTTLPITQFYAITHDPQIPERLYGGTQDNSTSARLGTGTNDWSTIYYGDGFYVQVDPIFPSRIYACYQYGGLGRSDNGGASFVDIQGDMQRDRTNWMMPYQIDPHNPARLYAGTYRVWKSEDIGNSWTALSPDLTDSVANTSFAYSTITTLAVSPLDSTLIYVGTDDAHVWRTVNGGADWEPLDATLPQRWVTRVVPDPVDTNTVYVTFSGYKQNDSTAYVYRSTDRGTNWTAISETLPQAPVNDLVVDPLYQDYLYVANDFGVYVTYDLGEHWEALGEGLPFVTVHDLEYIPSLRRLVAGTHGRSMYSYSLAGVTDVTDQGGGVAQPGSFTLQSHPNPFNSSTQVVMELPESGRLHVTVYDILGRKVTTLFDGTVAAGLKRLSWDASQDGQPVASGTYILHAELNNRKLDRRVTLVR